MERLTWIYQRISAATVDKATLTKLFSTFDLDAIRDRLTGALFGDAYSFEMVFVDGGSTEDSPELLERSHRRYGGALGGAGITEAGRLQMKHLTRRGFMASAAAAAITARAAGAKGSGKTKRKFTMALIGSAIGVKGSIRQQLEWATKYGFESIEPSLGDLRRMPTTAVYEFTAEMKERGLQWAVTGVPVNIREHSEDAFTAQLKGLEAAAKVWQSAGATRVKSAIMSFHQDLNYLDNFRLHTDRIRRAAEVLNTHGLRFGLEYLASKLLWTLQRHPFVHTMAETRELIERTGADNVGLVLDSWHWYCSRETEADILALSNKDVISCDLNDAPTGIAIDDQVDSIRALPATTGVIDVKTFLNALIQIGYDGSIMAEPFDNALNALGNEEALQRTAEAMKKTFALVE